MELKSLFCPNCGAALDIEDGLDTFYCKYCGYKILLKGQSEAAYEAKVRVKEMEHKERLQDKKDAQKRLRMEAKERENKREGLFLFLIIGFLAVALMVMWFEGATGAEQQEKELEETVEQIMVCIDNGDFAEAYVKANTLYWDDSWTSEGEDKWDAVREEVIAQIKAAEAKALE